jgi:hypothetical protein
MRKLLAALPVSLIACAALSSGAQAAIVTVGSSPEGSYNMGAPGSQPELVTDTSFADPSLKVVSPVSGVVVGWHLFDAEGSGFALYTLAHGIGRTYTATGSTPASPPATGSLQSFSAALPIDAGEAIGLLVPAGASAGVSNNGGDGGLGWQPPLGPGETKEGDAIPAAYGFDAEVQPPPTVSLLGTTTGPTSGGTTVQIAGTDLEGTTSVRFGSTPATFHRVSEAVVEATSPAGSVGSTPVTVTTIAGTATSSQPFTYQAPATPTPAPPPTCTVPKLEGKSLKASKSRIKGADCKLGKVARKKGTKAKTGRVVGQSKKPGTVLPAGTVVKVTLGKG